MKRLGLCLVSLAIIGLIFVVQTTPSAAAEAKTILIGFTASQTGKLNVEGMRQINGLNLWVEQVNAAGGVKLADGTVVKFGTKFYDDESKKERVQELYTKLISGDKADFLISPYSSGLADAAAVIAQQYNKIMITTGAASDSTYKKGYTLIYQAYTPASRYLTGAVDLLAKLAPSAKTIAVIHEKDKFSTDVVTALKKYRKRKVIRCRFLKVMIRAPLISPPLSTKFRCRWAPSWAAGILPTPPPSPSSSMKRKSTPA